MRFFVLDAINRSFEAQERKSFRVVQHAISRVVGNLHFEATHKIVELKTEIVDKRQSSMLFYSCNCKIDVPHVLEQLLYVFNNFQHICKNKIVLLLI